MGRDRGRGRCPWRWTTKTRRLLRTAAVLLGVSLSLMAGCTNFRAITNDAADDRRGAEPDGGDRVETQDGFGGRIGTGGSGGDAGVDSPGDAGVDSPAEAGVDSPADAGVDSPADAHLAVNGQSCMGKADCASGY